MTKYFQIKYYEFSHSKGKIRAVMLTFVCPSQYFVIEILDIHPTADEVFVVLRFTQRMPLAVYGRFGTSCLSHFKGKSSPRRMSGKSKSEVILGIVWVAIDSLGK